MRESRPRGPKLPVNEGPSIPSKWLVGMGRQELDERRTIMTVIIGVRKILDESQMETLGGALGEDACVTSMQRSQNCPNLILMKYDESRCQRAEILGRLDRNGVPGKVTGC